MAACLPRTWQIYQARRCGKSKAFCALRPAVPSPAACRDPENRRSCSAMRNFSTRLCQSLGQNVNRHSACMHEWAGTWRDKGWPAATPEYLLAGYYQILADADDIPRMISLAGDAVRHGRMRELTGGDSDALAEIRAALNKITAQDRPDLVTALCLAFHRDDLTSRNINIPVGLPAPCHRYLGARAGDIWVPLPVVRPRQSRAALTRSVAWRSQAALGRRRASRPPRQSAAAQLARSAGRSLARRRTSRTGRRAPRPCRPRPRKPFRGSRRAGQARPRSLR